MSSGTYTANLKFELIDHEVKRAFEVLQGEKNEGKRYAAVLILREIAFSMPTFFFQNVSQFFGVIYFAVLDPKLKVATNNLFVHKCKICNGVVLVRSFASQQ